MKRILTLTLFVCLLAPAAMADLDGAWTASLEEKHPDRIYFSVIRGHHQQMGMTMRVAEFTALTPAQINATTMTPVDFQLNREAGNTRFEGTFRNGKGAGQFTFTPNRKYFDTIRSLGVDPDLRKHRRHKREDGDADGEEQTLFTLAIHDVSSAFIRSMQSEGFKTTLEKYLELRIFNVTPEYIREMRSLGFKDIDEDELVASRIHKVTPEYIRETRAAGWKLDLDELQSTRIHGATPAFMEEMRKLGYGNLDIDDLISFRIHRVTPEFITELRALGYNEIPADDLVSMRIHRVTPEYIRELKAVGYSGIPVEKLVSMRIAGIDAKTIKAMH